MERKRELWEWTFMWLTIRNTFNRVIEQIKVEGIETKRRRAAECFSFVAFGGPKAAAASDCTDYQTYMLSLLLITYLFIKARQNNYGWQISDSLFGGNYNTVERGLRNRQQQPDLQNQRPVSFSLNHLCWVFTPLAASFCWSMNNFRIWCLDIGCVLITFSLLVWKVCALVKLHAAL